MEDSHWVGLAEAIRHNSILRELTLMNVGFGDQSMAALSASLTMNNTLCSIDLRRSRHVTKVGENAFRDNLSSIHGLRRNLLSRFFEIGYGDIEFARALRVGWRRTLPWEKFTVCVTFRM